MNKIKKYLRRNILKIVFAFLLVIFLVIVWAVLWQALIFKSHRDYFKQPLKDQQIQEWMTFRLVERYYHIDLQSVLHQTLPFSELKNPISAYCAKERLDCSKVAADLENYKELHSMPNND